MPPWPSTARRRFGQPPPARRSPASTAKPARVRAPRPRLRRASCRFRSSALFVLRAGDPSPDSTSLGLLLVERRRAFELVQELVVLICRRRGLTWLLGRWFGRTGVLALIL